MEDNTVPKHKVPQQTITSIAKARYDVFDNLNHCRSFQDIYVFAFQEGYLHSLQAARDILHVLTSFEFNNPGDVIVDWQLRKITEIKEKYKGLI